MQATVLDAQAWSSARPIPLPSALTAHIVFHPYHTVPKPSMASKLTLGTGQVSMGRARWGVDGASVFSVADGKALAQVCIHTQ